MSTNDDDNELVFVLNHEKKTFHIKILNRTKIQEICYQANMYTNSAILRACWEQIVIKWT